MNAPITFNGILAVLAIIVGVVAGITAIIAVVKWINNAHDRAKKWDEYGMQIDDLRKDIKSNLREIKDEQYVLTNCMLAVLDGLQQLGANHGVTEAYKNLANHINKEAHDVSKE